MLTRPVKRRLRSSRSRAAHSRWLCACLVALFALQADAQSAPESADDAFDELMEAEEDAEEASAKRAAGAAYDGRWLPTLTVGLGVMMTPQSATATSDGDSPESEFVEIGDSQLSVSPQFVILAGIETPELVRGVRLFASGGVIPTIAFEVDITKQGDPRGFSYPRQRDDNLPYPEAAIDGTGIRTTAQIDPLAFAANLGVSYSTKIRDYQVDFRPSAAFFYHTVRAEGVRLRAIKPDTVEPFVREISLFDEYVESYPAVGPAFEVGVDLGRKGAFKPTVYLDASFYRVLGDRTVELSHAGSDEYGTETADWTMTVDPWAYRIGLGLRIAWIGK